MITKDNFKALLQSLGFTHTSAQIFAKSYGGGGRYTLKADFNAQKLIYPANTSNDTSHPNGIIIHDDTTSNFSHPENFVVFECVHRLLEKGYSPAHIELEPRWNLGRDSKGGKADILVRDNEGNPYLLIECKTTDSKNSEFRKEWARMQNDGGQLFSYFQQERGVKFLCLYTSDFVDNALKYENYIINMQDNEAYLKEHKKQGYKDANTTKELFSVWANTYANDFREQGIFEPQIQSYNISVIKPNLENLSHIDSHSMQKKRHEWATILRANAVGDRGLALNKFMNLLLCKITDEIENKDDLAFFWKGFSGDTPFELVDRLQKLYQIGMQKFLKQNITYHSKDSIDKAFSKHFRDTTVREKIQNIFNELKYFSNGDFNFIEVYNKEQFDKNFNILLPVVLSLQSIKFTDTKDSNILGDYFETYIHDMPQQEGQYFTPVPLVNFIINSLPTFHQTQVLDFACGAGHFLTQYAEFHKGKDIAFFGIDKDSRLAKIAKIASFMHGIDSHIEANDSLKLDIIKNQSCNVLISNPPYSVDGFLGNLTQSDREQYELFSKNINIESNDKIQCFLIEKASKSLKSGGLLALVLPSSLLNKSTEIDSKTIEILLRDFYIISICALGDSTFFKTGTQPIILYATRKPQRQGTATTKDDIYEDFIKHILEGKVDELPKIYDNFLALLEQYALFRGIDKDELKALFALNLARYSTLYQNESFVEYKEEYQKIIFKQKAEYDKKSAKYKDNNPFVPTQSQAEFVREKECEKFLYFCYCIDSTPLIIKAPSDKKEQKKFLGYEWSTTKGQEGIRYLNATSIAQIQTPLYNPKNQFDTNKLNYYILQNFYTHFETTQEANICESQDIYWEAMIPKELEKYAFKARLVDMIDFSRADFSKAINLNLSNVSSQSANPFANSKFEIVRLGEVVESLGKGKRPASFENKNGAINFYKSSFEIYKCDSSDFDTEALIIGDGGSANLHYVNGKFSASDHTYIFKPQNNQISLRYIYFVIRNNLEILQAGFKGIALQNIAKKFIENEIKIPLPPLEIQKQIVAECEKIESQSQNINDLIALYKDLIRAILGKCGIGDIDAPLPSLRESTDTITTLLDLINKGESNLDFEALCHSEGVRSTTEESKTNFLDTSAFAKPQYDKNATMRSESSLDFDKEPTPKSPPQGRGLSHSPSLAEGARGWVENLTTLLKSLPTPPKNGWDTIALSNSDIFELQIGERVLDNELHEQGKIPVYSANVTKPFGFIEKELLEKLENYDKDSVLWGIDGDFMISFIPKNTPFYPTDHCGVLRVKDKSVNVRIAGFGLENEGAKFGFSRNLRASISRIKSLKIPLPPLSEQNKIIAPIEKIEAQIARLRSILPTLQDWRKYIIEKYLF